MIVASQRIQNIHLGGFQKFADDRNLVERFAKFMAEGVLKAHQSEFEDLLTYQVSGKTSQNDKDYVIREMITQLQKFKAFEVLADMLALLRRYPDSIVDGETKLYVEMVRFNQDLPVDYPLVRQYFKDEDLSLLLAKPYTGNIPGRTPLPDNLLWLARNWSVIVQRAARIAEKNAQLKLPEKSNRVFQFWHSGLEDAPEIIQLIASHNKRVLGQRQVYLDGKTILDYITPDPAFAYFKQDLPEQRAHAADYLRSVLLAKYGGWWIDATNIINPPALAIIDQVSDHDQIITSKFKPDNIIMVISSLMGGIKPNNPIMLLIQAAKEIYMQTHDTYPEYFYIDLIYRYILSKNIEALELVKGSQVLSYDSQFSMSTYFYNMGKKLSQYQAAFDAMWTAPFIKTTYKTVDNAPADSVVGAILQHLRDEAATH